MVGIGASAGGLEACTKLVAAIQPGSGIAFILVQHLDPTHESMMVELLAKHTKLSVQEARDGLQLAPDCLYVIPPGTYLSVADGALRLSSRQTQHGVRLPFDLLLQSLADAYGPRGACVILSGTGADGSAGLVPLKIAGGLVVAQDPTEAAYGGMPESASATGRVDLVLPVAAIPAALADWARHTPGTLDPDRNGSERPELPVILDLLKSKTVYDFSLYKPGTLHRRAERRMAMAGMAPNETERYLQLLRTDPGERDQLAKDLLIHVTSFFRDPAVFAHLAKSVIPDIVRQQAPDRPLRIWVAGCSTGEETYSLAMLFQEEIGRTGSHVQLQVFASDVDADAIATARDGLYPATIEECVSTERLRRFFSQEGRGWRVSGGLRAAAVFAVQDVLADPPFVRLDMVSCRNLLIYFQRDAQQKAISVFHFALREGGLLLLGTAETPGGAVGRFEVVAKAERLYRRVGRSRAESLGFPIPPGSCLKLRAIAGVRPPSRQLTLAELSRRLVLDSHAPAAVLINYANECLFSLGPTDRYLRLAPGHPTHDLLAITRPGLRATLRSAIDGARRDRTPTAVVCRAASVTIKAELVLENDEELLLVCFVDVMRAEADPTRPALDRNAPHIAELERELDATRTDLQVALRDLELSNEEQKTIKEEALSINEEFQLTNEELLASKEELQSLNEELTVLNSQLQETLERQRATSDDLQNVLFSTNVATLFLDLDLRIRFYTPATTSLFALLPSDVGRPLADLHSLAADGALGSDARAVLADLAPVEREIEAAGGVWFRRRVMPYRTQGDRVKGIVLTFTDITGRKQVARALEEAKQQADQASAAKSRFLAAASHDLRQPLQTLSLLQGLLAKTVQGGKAQTLIARQDDTLGAMAAMLDALLDINQIEAGVVRAEVSSFPIGELLGRMRDEFTYQAAAKGLALRIAVCSQEVRSDPKLLEQIIRNLLSNAMKYTEAGKILLGCRRRGPMLSVEIWDTGIGIPGDELQAIFEEYHQVGNAARERSRGLGLGLSIVQRLSTLLDHRVRVSSRAGKGSMFAVEMLAVDLPMPAAAPVSKKAAAPQTAQTQGMIMIIEDDPDLRDLLGILLESEGYQVARAPDGPAALTLVQDGRAAPDLLLADFNLPAGLNGLQAVLQIRQAMRQDIPAIILTGDISTGTMQEVASGDCTQLNKPVKHEALMKAVSLLTAPDLVPASAPFPGQAVAAQRTGPVVFVVDDDSAVRAAIRSVLEDDGQTVEDFVNGEAFLAAHRMGSEGCLLIDAYLPGMDGLGLLRHLQAVGSQLPAIMITGRSDVAMAVHAMKAGASDFIEKPVGRDELLASIGRALEQARDKGKQVIWRDDAARHVAALTPRQKQIMALVVAGQPSKNIAADLGISQRTVENHRASIMRKTGSASLPALARLVLATTWDVKADVPDEEGAS